MWCPVIKNFHFSRTIFDEVDLAGIEPASESLSIAASPITVTVLTFPPRHAR